MHVLVFWCHPFCACPNHCSLALSSVSMPVLCLTSLFRTLSHCKGNVDLYSASLRTPLTHSDMDHTVLPANKTISAFTHKQSPGGTSANAWVQITTHLWTPRGWMAELAMLADILQMVYPEEITRQLHIIVQATECSQVIDWCSNHCAMPPTLCSNSQYVALPFGIHSL